MVSARSGEASRWFTVELTPRSLHSSAICPAAAFITDDGKSSGEAASGPPSR